MVLESAYGLGLSRERDSQPMVLVYQQRVNLWSWSQHMVLVCQERERQSTYGLGLSRESTYGLSRESAYGLSV